ncbi:MAG: tRNA uridine-5-carboxymethylaminomethyl(34) synthesis GTPase MnmE, partial [Elusimicrobia bacterium]|nr:tRNA uridine-5-carboxymethylaminomethyl(34) synthesis GTPase MnmE [Elusimicrobiota bacterium]
EDLVELSLHGSPYILSRALARALVRARLARPGEFTQRAFLAGKLDLAQAEAVCSLIRSRSEAAHRAALRQLSGGLSQAIRDCRRPIFELLVRVEACLDHPEEDIPSLTAEQACAALRQARQPLLRLADSFSQGRLAAEGARIALLGRPNAGKSSLLNALLGRERAIVQPTPGTTRDTIEEPSELQGLPAVLIDTAGLREGGVDGAEREGARRSRAELGDCDAAVLVIDAARRPEGEDRRIHDGIIEALARRRAPLVCALNKSDLGRAWEEEGLPNPVAVSALRGDGLEELRRTLGGLLVGTQPPPVLITSARHAAALQKAASELEEALSAVEYHGARWEDRAACHLREADRALGLILGENAGEDALHAIFSRFCVGK